jgi:hypothetical protein
MLKASQLSPLVTQEAFFPTNFQAKTQKKLIIPFALFRVEQNLKLFIHLSLFSLAREKKHEGILQKEL